MKKRLTRLLLLTALLLPLWHGAEGQTLTICDGTATPSTRVPFYGYAADEGDQRSQFVYPARLLAPVDGGEISAMTFYLNQIPTISNGPLKMKFQLTETADTIFGNYNYKPITDATMVYYGDLTFSDSTLTITFTTPYSYNGGNLLVDVQAYSSENGYGTCPFRGMATAHYSSVNCIEEEDYDDYGMITAIPGSLSYGDKFKFLPKVSFAYTNNTSCLKPLNLMASNIQPDSATFAWTPAGNETSWLVYLDGVLLEQTVYDTFVFADLSPNTSYTLGVRALCDVYDTSELSTLHIHTACGPMAYSSLPWTADFEDVVIGSSNNVSLSQVPCWLALDKYEPYISYPCIYQSVNHTTNGAKSLALSGSSTTHPIAALPQFEAALNELTLSFYLRVSNGTMANSDLEVGVLTNDDQASSFLAIDTLHFAAGNMNEWQYFEKVFDTDSTGRLAFRWNGTLNAYIDDIVVSQRQSCDRPDGVVASEVGDDWATLTMDDPLSVMNYGLRIVSGTDTILASIDNDMSTTVSGLQPATLYSVEAWAVCYDGTTTTSVQSTFRTTASPVDQMPYATGFEDEDDRAWALVNGANGWVIDSACAADSLYSLYISNDGGLSNTYTTSGTTQSYATRQFALMADQYSIDFDWRCEGELSATGHYYDYMRVLLAPADVALDVNSMPYPSSTSGSLPAGWVSLSPNLAGEGAWQHHHLDFIVDSDAVYTMVILWHNDISGGSGNGAAIDNILFSQVSCYQPQALVADTIGEDMLGISWNGRGTESYWLVDITGADSLIRVDTTAITLTGLTPSTLYDITVYAYCGSGDTSQPATLQVLTQQVPIETLPYTTGFEPGDDAGWLTINGANGWYIGSAVAHTGTNALYVSADSGAANTYLPGRTSASYAFRSINLTEGEYEMSFDWQGYGELNSDYMRAWLCPADALFKADTLPNGNASYLSSSYWQQSPAGWIDIAGGKKNLKNSWQHSVETFTVDSTGLYNIVFMWVNDATSGINPAAAVDNITLRPVSCPAPSAVVLDSATTTSLAISWTPTGTESQWAVTVDGSTTVVATTSHTATGLTAGTAYQVSVRPVCGVGDTGVATTATMRTACGLQSIPYVEGFETMEVGEVGCWSVAVPYQGMSSLYPHVYQSSASAHSGNRYMYGYMADDGREMLFATPMLDANANGLIVNFHAKFYRQLPSMDYENSEVWMHVGVMSDPTDSATFVAVADTFAMIDEWAEFTLHIPASVYGGGQTAIAFRVVNDGTTGRTYCSLDDLTVSEETELPCIVEAPTDLIVSAIADHEATISWTPVADATYELAICTGPWSTPAASAIVATEASTYRYEHLEANTDYTVGVRSVYTCGDTSAWATVGFQTTLTGIDAVSAMPLSLSPNPASHSVHLGGLAVGATITLVDQQGRELMHLTAQAESLSLDLSSLPRGIYYLRSAGRTAKLVLQ